MDKAYYNDNFFVIESDDLENVKGRIYGYVIDKNKIIINSEECNYPLSRENYGCYVNVVTTPERIELYQDYFGSYGIYLYEKDNYFVLSNSFLYLANYLKVRRKLTYDDEYAKAFLAAPQAALAYSDTMIEEIKMLPRNACVVINKKSKDLKINLYEEKESFIDMNTKEAVDIIDEWHKKWNTIFKSILKENLYLSFGISGGKDSRVSLACCMKPRLELEKIDFISATDSLATHSDDYKIAKQIAEQYVFTLNTGSQPKRYKMNPLENLNVSLLIKCGFHRELMPFHFWFEKPVFRITGSGGDLRELWNEPAEDYIERMCNWTVFNSVNCREALKKMLNKTKEQIDTYVRGGAFTATDYFYKQARQRNHNGKGNAELFMGNTIILSPLMDPMLYKLNQNIGKENDNDLLYGVIYNRYLPEITDIGFDSGRTVKKETMEVAKEINNLYPLKEINDESFETLEFSYNRVPPKQSNDKNVAHDYLKKMFYSEEVKKFVYQIFGEELYKRADIYYKTREYHPYIAAAGLVESYIIYEAVRVSNEINNPYRSVALFEDIFTPRNYSNNGFMKECLDYLQSGRFDIKNFGAGNNKIVFQSSSDENLYVSTPEWFVNHQGKGKIFQSCRGEAKIYFQTIGKGELSIKVTGPWIKDDDNKPLSVKIDFMKFCVRDIETNKELVFAPEPFTVDSMNPWNFKIPCEDEQKFVVEAEWLSYIYGESELVRLLGQMYYKSIGYYKFWKKSNDNLKD